MKEFLLELQAVISPDLPFNFGSIPYTGVNMPLKFFDTRQLCEDTGFETKVTFGEGVRKTYDWLIKEKMND